ncbi:hypothetical protein SAMN02745163_00802 [Clostridium cavendishii DSM 21758]|uniref:Type III secretion system, E component of needle n=1 Tax=Clostridium cavendishii DSM 21758 TaxID=1121302 RepID=A0A1M6EAE8_9CLOT|nr:hypothetical protein [Clostridium cavendishii]SHI82393.1 hypothetical protein SAMN02745163_00802 [Clostridium cavendishii DSM 21758]
MNNAIENVKTAAHDLQHARQHIQDALNSVEKQENRTKIQGTLSAIDNAITSAQQTINNYMESSK